MDKPFFIYRKPTAKPAHPNIKVYFTPNQEAISLEIHEPGYPAALEIPESLVHHIWAQLQFERHNLATSSGQSVTILHPGSLNFSEGPDFKNARVKLDGRTLQGDIEIHCLSQSWYSHNHDQDSRYDNVILHVTLFPDLWTGKLATSEGNVLPELILADYLTQSLRSLLYAFRTKEVSQLPCSPFQYRIPDALIKDTLKKKGHEYYQVRLQQFIEAIQMASDSHQVLQQFLYRGMGYGPNKNQMEELARRLPLAFCRQFDNRKDLEAVHFGVAGLLPEQGKLALSGYQEKRYGSDLIRRFEHFKEQFALTTMPTQSWHTFRMRPVNLPSFRIAQLIAWLEPGGFFETGMSFLDTLKTPNDFSLHKMQHLLTIRSQGFWKNHYHFYKASKKQTPGLGRDRIDKLIANSILPYLMLKREWEGHAGLDTQIGKLLTRLPPENDRITRYFRSLNTRPDSMFESRALHYLYKNGCATAGCLECPIGQHIMHTPPER